MKTAVEYIELRLLGIASFDSEELRLRYKDIIKQAKEIEKEQIIEARDGREISSFTTGKDYYDLNFNHHIESEANTYANFTPHNANAVAEYNEGLKNFTPDNANAVAEYNEGLKNFTPNKQPMKTSMQELLENLQKSFDEKTYPIRIDATYSLEKEKEQFHDMFEEGFESAYQHFVNGKDFVKFEEYYNQTYNQNK